MEVIETILSRVGFFGNVRSLNPAGLSLRSIHDGLLERYKFLVYPRNPGDWDFTVGINYSDGEFLYRGKTIAVTLKLFTDGWAVDTLASTDAAEAFWNDVADWVTSLGFRPAKEAIKRRVYESQVVVRADVDLAKPFDRLHDFVKLISELSGNPSQQLSGVYIGPDAAMLSTFTFERRQGIPFSENTYFSRASLPTSHHLAALEMIEKILTP